MPEKVRVLGISGSLRAASYNTGALKAAIELCPDDAEVEICSIDGFSGFNQDEDNPPPKNVLEFKAKIRAADAILFASPEYNYSIPGVLKNAIDWASRPYTDNAWDGKPAAIMGCSIGGIATARMQYHLRQVMVFLDMHPLNKPEVMIGHAADKFDADGRLTDEKTREHIRKMLVALVDWTRRVKG
ncbi:MAG: NAD(P)H-dependent oxidoreductase [Chloracidobacterium sp.]|nr:NAD(P)H-dependent oxidoreductase [Chloracidobacterium sp.]